MDITRYHLFLAGVVVALLGFEFRMVDSLVLSSKATRFLAEQSGHPMVAISDAANTVTGNEGAFPTKVIHPPEWIGWFFISFGAVLILQSCAMPKPG